MSDWLWPHGLQHARPPCPSPTPRVYSNSCPLSRWCHPTILPSVFPSITVFSKESVLHIRWPKYWSFSFSIISSNEYSGLISFRMDWLDLLAVQGTARWSNQLILKEINPEYSLEEMMLKLKLQYFDHMMLRANSLEKTLGKIFGKDVGKNWQEEKRTTEDEMVGWPHSLSGHEFEQIRGDSDGQWSLVCCSPWGGRVGHYLATEQQQQTTSLQVDMHFLSLST